MNMEYTYNAHLDIHTFRIEVTEEEMQKAGVYKLGKKPTKLQSIYMLKRVAEDEANNDEGRHEGD